MNIQGASGIKDQDKGGTSGRTIFEIKKYPHLSVSVCLNNDDDDDDNLLKFPRSRYIYTYVQI
jgi:hypothetical protein